MKVGHQESIRARRPAIRGKPGWHFVFALALLGRLASAWGAPLDLEHAREHWAYRLPVRPEIPAVKNRGWPRTEIDRFILSRGEERGLAPAPDAPRAVLARRLYFDLTGLAPTPEEIASFENDPHPEAVRMLADRLLASPHFGERWGRHWLDVARYAESVTLRGLAFKEAWRYRDYVVGSFNRDLPFDRFVKEQISGDLLERGTLEETRQARIATAFLVLGNFNYEEQDKEQLRMDIVDEQLDTIGKAFLAQTLGCARCHDHKFDPIPTRDYYAMAGILRNTRSAEHANVSTWLEVPLPLGEAEEARVKAHETRIAELQRQVRKLTESGSGGAGGNADDLTEARAELKRAELEGPSRPMAMSVREEEKIGDCPVHSRGDAHRPGELAPRGFLRAADYQPAAEFDGRESGRRQLGEWIANEKNPLTARVFVNRAWHWLMGAGIVRSTDNFGTTGDAPTHPALLDYLATETMRQGWSMKWAIREIVISRAYRLASQAPTGLREADPENRLFLRANRKRLEPEAMRDAMLQAAGMLDPAMGGATIAPGTAADYGYMDEGHRRSIYVPAFRNAPPQIFELFDGADTSVVCGQRNASIVATQALFLLNHPFVSEQAWRAARRLLASPGDDGARVNRLYRTVLGREPGSGEREIAARHLARAGAGEEAWAGLCQALFASADFRFID